MCHFYVLQQQSKTAAVVFIPWRWRLLSVVGAEIRDGPVRKEVASPGPWRRRLGRVVGVGIRDGPARGEVAGPGPGHIAGNEGRRATTDGWCEAADERWIGWWWLEAHEAWFGEWWIHGGGA